MSYLKTTYLPIKSCCLLALICFCTLSLNAQLYIEAGALHVQKNAVLKVESNLVTAKPSTLSPIIRNWGTIAVTGNTQFHADTDYKGQGNLCFVRTSAQTLSASFPLKKIDIQNNSNVELSGNFNLQGELKLTNGHLVCGNYDLTLDDSVTISGGSSSSYIRINGTGVCVLTLIDFQVLVT